MIGTRYRTFVVVGAVLLALFAMYWSGFFTTTHSITTDLAQFDLVGERVEDDFTQYPLVSLNDEYTLTDTLKDGVEITYGSQASTTFASPDQSGSLTLQFPKSLSEPLTITLPGNRTFTVTHNVEGHYQSELLTNGAADLPQTETALGHLADPKSLLEAETAAPNDTPTYLKYTSPNSRTHTYYAYQKDQAAGYRNLKHWTIYQSGTGQETASYTFANAHLKTNDRGEVEVRYLGTYEVPRSGEEGGGVVEADLWARAQRVIAEDQLANIENQPPDLTIPAPYTIDANGTHTTHEWVVTPQSAIDPSDTSGDYVLSVTFTVPLLGYPIALDPTLQFTAPGTSNSGDVITGEAQVSDFGISMTTGDWNGDGKTDLAVGASGYDVTTNSGEGRVYIFWSSERPSDSAEADVIITGETTLSTFGGSLATGDFNADGRDDLVVGSHLYSVSSFSLEGRAYIFYGGSLTSKNASAADVTLTGETTNNYFGYSLTTGDFNADGTDDLAIGAYGYSTATGRTYLFYSTSTPGSRNASAADVIFTGEGNGHRFGYSLTTGDFNADGTDDLVVGAYGYTTNTGRSYLFYGSDMVSENASSADIILTGETTNSRFGRSLTTGDFNADGKDDLAVGAEGYSTATGRTYLFYSTSTPGSRNASAADVIFTGEIANDNFGWSLTTGDFNADGTDDLVVGAYGYTTNTGRSYLFYGSDMVSENASSADIILTGETTNSRFGRSLTTGDFNADGKDDLLVGAYQYNSSQGRAYIFYSQSGQVNLNEHITGEGTNDYFGSAFAVGDFNSDGRDDLAVGAYKDNSNTGKVYIFYNTGAYPTAAGSADVVITGAANTQFGYSLAAGDVNDDGVDDLLVGAVQYSTYSGRVYVFYGGSITTEASTGADATLTGGANYDQFGTAIAVGDLNSDGIDDVVASAPPYTTNTGRAYIFYGSSSFASETTSGADVTITGESTTNYFGSTIAIGDLNADGANDLIAGAYANTSYTGRVYVFYGGSITTENASGADVLLSGEGTSQRFGSQVAVADLNNDGTDDIAASAEYWNTATGRVYLFYGGGLSSTTADNADVTIDGVNTFDVFGASLATGDLNHDGRVDLAVGSDLVAKGSLVIGEAYIFFNDGSYPAYASTSDITITGDSDDDEFGFALATGDFNADGKDDLVIGAPGYNNGGDTGRIYFYETREDYAWEIQRQSLADGLRVDPLMGYELKITGEAAIDNFGRVGVGDFNNDGKDDLAVSARTYGNSNTGKIYIFYNDGNYPTKAGRADHQIVGQNASEYFGDQVKVGDFNADGTDDLAIGAYNYNSAQGRVYLFYGGTSIPTSNADADATITGEGAADSFGIAVIAGDFNADGKEDVAVGADDYDVGAGTNEGRVYIFHNDGTGSYPATAGSADVTITGSVTTKLGKVLSSGDLDGDGTTDLVVGATYTSSAVYVFYNDGSIPTTAATADESVSLPSGSMYAMAVATGDLDRDGDDDLLIGNHKYDSTTGIVYLFENDGSYPSSFAAADATVVGEATGSEFGSTIVVADFDQDGQLGVAVGAYSYNVSSGEGRVYVLNTVSLTGTTTATSADAILTGEVSGGNYGNSLAAGDINNDGTADLLVSATGYNTFQGRLYFYTTNDRHMTGEGTDSNFGSSFAVGDFNADGKNDLAVGASSYSSDTGRTYLFYGGRKATTTATGADVILTGVATDDAFGVSLATGDFNHDGTDDLAVGALGYNSYQGRAYLFYGGSMVSGSATGADVTLTGEVADDAFGASLTTGDFNADGTDDLVVGAPYYSVGSYTYEGRAYLFYSTSTPGSRGAATADVTLTGVAVEDSFGFTLTTGDFNADGTDDLAVGVYWYNSFQGRTYLFYGGSMVNESASGADVTLTGEATSNEFGSTLTTGDFNHDGTDDLAVGAPGYNSSQGRTYLFYGGSLTSKNALAADVVLTGEAVWDQFSVSLTTGDFNADGTDDLAVGAQGYSSVSFTGRVYLFYGNQLYTTDAENANVIITGENPENSFGGELVAGDLSGNGVDDIIIGARGYDETDENNEGRVYIITSEAAAERYSHFWINGDLKFEGSVKFE